MSELLAGLPPSYALLVILVMASMFYSLSGYRGKLAAKFRGDDVHMDWIKFRNTALMGLGIAVAAWVCTELGVAGFEGITFDTHADFARNFLSATAAVMIIHKWVLGDMMKGKEKKNPSAVGGG